MDYILFYSSSSDIFQYAAAELFSLQTHVTEPPLTLRSHQDIIYYPRQKYIHRGSRRNYIYSDTGPIRSFWSSSQCPPKKSIRTVDHSVLADIARTTSIESGTTDLTFGLFNIHSLTNKGPLIYDLLNDSKFDFLCLTETWQQSHDFSQLNQSVPPGFTHTCQPRASGRGGGLAILYNEKWKASLMNMYESFESTVL